jgi:hypothetical protein
MGMTCPDIPVRVGKALTCGCCGSGFRTWEGYIHQDQDNGYGICMHCQDSIEQSNIEQMDQAINLMMVALNDSNRARFLAMSRDRQERLVLQAIQDGVLSWAIRTG